MLQSTKRPQRQLAPRKDPSQDRSRATINRIIEATWDILGTKGAKAVNTRSIAAASGVTTGSIYQYFPNKEAILFELLKRRLDEVVQSFDQLRTPALLNLAPLKWMEECTRTFDRLGWNQPAQLELDKACKWDARLAKLHDTHYRRMLDKITELYRHFYPHADEDSIRVLAKFAYGIELLEARLLQAETPAGRALVRQWRTDILKGLLARMEPT